MQLERLSDAAEVARRAADRVQATLRANPCANLLLPAGATPVALYAELRERARAGAIDFDRAGLFQLDEVVGRGRADGRSFAAFLHTHLLDALGARRGVTGVLDGAAADPVAAVAAHAGALAAAGGADLALLGLGRNGHVAFNEPGARPREAARVVDLAPETRAAQGGTGARRGMTLGLLEILGARRIVLLVTGAEKAAILARLLAGAPGDALPASWVAASPAAHVLADAAALAGAARVDPAVEESAP